MGWEGVNKREFPRVRQRCLIKLSREGKEQEVESFTENIGVGGVCVFTSIPFFMFEELQVKVFLSEERVVSCRGEVVWVVRRRPADHSDRISFDVGIQFKNLSQESKVLLQDVMGKDRS